MPIIVNNLSYTYGRGTPLAAEALRGVDMTIGEGQFVGVVGAMGAGKSTLMQHLNGLILPPPGTVFVDGDDVGAKGTDLLSIRQRVGLVFQYPEQQLFAESVFEDVAFGPRNVGLDEQAVARRVKDALAAVGLSLEELGARSPFALSGGQQRRVALAGVLALQPKYLILDEPTAGLDPKAKRELLQLLMQLHTERQMTVVLVTHHMEDVARMAEKMFVLGEGRIVLQGTPAEVMGAHRRQQLRRLGLDVPVAVQLVAQLNERGWHLPTDIVDEEEIIKVVGEAARNRV